VSATLASALGTRPTSPYADPLAALTRHRGVLGCLIVDAEQGLVVDASLQHGVQGDAIAALAASLFRKARLSARAAGLGEASALRLEAETGQILIVGRGDVLLVVAAEPFANVGLLRAEMRRAAERM
jgi:predicted regulator of Ras-like GTPase activity (Roadblock/LC7/MglB family)